MSSLDDKRKKPEKSYGRKPYVVVNSENDTYNDMMTTIPRKAMLDQRLEKKSQFDKPYLNDGNYSDMEYGQAPRIPSFSNPKFNFPPFPGPVPTDLELPVAWAWPPCMSTLNSPFYCIKCEEDKDWVSQSKLHFMMVRDGYFPGGLLGGLAIASVNTTIFLNRSVYDNLDRSRAGEIKINEPSGGWNVGDILEAVTRCKDQDGNVIVGCSDKIRIFCRDQDCDCCTAPSYVAMTLVAGSTDDTIDNANPATVVVQDGCPNYIWGVSGTGYSINPSGSSASLSAVVSVVGGTCGVNYAAYGTVTVTDECGTTVTKKIRNTGGAWVSQGSVCGMSGAFDTRTWNGTGYDLVKVSEDQRQLQTVQYEGHADADQCTGGCAGVDFTSTAWCDNFGYEAQGVCIWNSTWCTCHNISDPVGCDSYRTQSIEHFHWGCP